MPKSRDTRYRYLFTITPQDLQSSSMSVLLRFVNQSCLFMCATEFHTIGFPYAC